MPRDIAIVGFDDVADAADYRPALTTVAVPREELGRMAAEKLFDLIDFPGQSPIRISMPVRIVVRESCGAKLAQGTKGWPDEKMTVGREADDGAASSTTDSL